MAKKIGFLCFILFFITGCYENPRNIENFINNQISDTTEYSSIDQILYQYNFNDEAYMALANMECGSEGQALYVAMCIVEEEIKPIYSSYHGSFSPFPIVEDNGSFVIYSGDPYYSISSTNYDYYFGFEVGKYQTVLYNDKEIDSYTFEINMNEQDIDLTIWAMPLLNTNQLDESLLQYQ